MSFARLKTILLAALVLAFTSVSAFADDWVAVKLRGTVMQFTSGEWVALQRGDVVSDERVVRTLRSGRVQFQRDAETIDLGPDTQVQISDRAGRRYTTVKQHYGTVTVEAEVQNVEHFSVETPHLAAVVKGTNFTVKTNDLRSTVSVKRGRVAVHSFGSDQQVVVIAGQSVTVEQGLSMDVSGSGELPVPVNPDGSPVLDGGAPLIDLDVELGGNGLSVGAGVGDLGVSASVGDGGINASVEAGGLGVSAQVGGGNGVSVQVGGLSVQVGGNHGNGNGNSGNGNGNGGGDGNSGNGGNSGGVLGGVTGAVGGLLGGLL